MKQYSFHEIENSDIYGVLSIIDYESTVRSILEQITFPSSKQDRRIVVDLALKSGMNQYRFLLLELSKAGKIIWNGNSYYKAPTCIEHWANIFLKEQKEFVENSVLSNRTAKKILG